MRTGSLAFYIALGTSFSFTDIVVDNFQTAVSIAANTVARLDFNQFHVTSTTKFGIGGMASQSLTVENCTFFSQTGISFTPAADAPSYFNISNSIFDGNAGVVGISVKFTYGALHMIITNATFSNYDASQANSPGLALQIETTLESSVSISNCSFSNPNTIGSLISAQELGSLSIDSCSFQNASYSPFFYSLGVYAINVPSVTITNSIFSNLFTTSSGAGTIGAIAVAAMNSGDYVVSIQNSSFINNFGYTAGAVFVSQGINLSIDNCDFSKNIGYQAAAVYSAGAMTITNSHFEMNNASVGAVYVRGLSSVSHSIFANNVATSYGGGIYVDETTLSLYNVSFESNTSEYSGGAIYVDVSRVTMDQIIFENNFAKSQGGGLYSTQSSVDITSTSFLGNSASYGGGVYCGTSNITMADSIFDANTASHGSDYYCSGCSINSTNIYPNNISCATN